MLKTQENCLFQLFSSLVNFFQFRSIFLYFSDSTHCDQRLFKKFDHDPVKIKQIQLKRLGQKDPKI